MLAYHGTTSDFSEFCLMNTELGIHFGSLECAKNRVYQLNSGVFVPHYVIAVELQVNRPLIVYDDIFHNAPYPLFRKLCSEDIVWEGTGLILTEEEEMRIIDKWDDDFSEHDYWDTSDNYKFYRELEDILKSKGYDCIKYCNYIESERYNYDEVSWCVFDSSNIKIIEKFRIDQESTKIGNVSGMTLF